MKGASNIAPFSFPHEVNPKLISFRLERNAEMNIETIISVISLLLGGGSLISIATWRYANRKAKADADKADAEAERADAEADKERQAYYQTLISDLAADREDRKRQNDELRAERDHYKSERNELRDELEKLRKEVQKLHDDRQKEREESQTRLMECDRKIARLSRKVDAMRPFLCTDLSCKKRSIVTIFDDEEKTEGEE